MKEFWMMKIKVGKTEEKRKWFLGTGSNEINEGSLSESRKAGNWLK